MGKTFGPEARLLRGKSWDLKILTCLGSPGGPVDKNSPANTEDMTFTPDMVRLHMLRGN